MVGPWGLLSLMSGITLLQFYEDVSDAEAIDRLKFDLRWKVALNLPLDFEPPHSSSLSVFRGRLVQHGQERYAFNRLLHVGRAAGFLPDRLTILVDTLGATRGGRGAGYLHPDSEKHSPGVETGGLSSAAQAARLVGQTWSPIWIATEKQTSIGPIPRPARLN